MSELCVPLLLGLTPCDRLTGAPGGLLLFWTLSFSKRPGHHSICKRPAAIQQHPANAPRPSCERPVAILRTPRGRPAAAPRPSCKRPAAVRRFPPRQAPRAAILRTPCGRPTNAPRPSDECPAAIRRTPRCRPAVAPRPPRGRPAAILRTPRAHPANAPRPSADSTGLRPIINTGICTDRTQGPIGRRAAWA